MDRCVFWLLCFFLAIEAYAGPSCSRAVRFAAATLTRNLKNDSSSKWEERFKRSFEEYQAPGIQLELLKTLYSNLLSQRELIENLDRYVRIHLPMISDRITRLSRHMLGIELTPPDEGETNFFELPSSVPITFHEIRGQVETAVLDDENDLNVALELQKKQARDVKLITIVQSFYQLCLQYELDRLLSLQEKRNTTRASKLSRRAQPVGEVLWILEPTEVQQQELVNKLSNADLEDVPRILDLSQQTHHSWVRVPGLLPQVDRVTMNFETTGREPLIFRAQKIHLVGSVVEFTRLSYPLRNLMKRMRLKGRVELEIDSVTFEAPASDVRNIPLARWFCVLSDDELTKVIVEFAESLSHEKDSMVVRIRRDKNGLPYFEIERQDGSWQLGVTIH